MLLPTIACKFSMLILLQTSIVLEASDPQSTNQCYSTSCDDKMTSMPKAGTQEFYGNYSFPTRPLRSVSCKGLEALKMIGKAVCVFFLNIICYSAFMKHFMRSLYFSKECDFRRFSFPTTYSYTTINLTQPTANIGAGTRERSKRLHGPNF